MSIKTIITAGFGNGTFLGTIKDVVLRGYDIGVQIVFPDIAESILSMIQQKGISQNSTIDATGQSTNSSITPTTGILSIIFTEGLGVSSAISETGQSLSTEL